MLQRMLAGSMSLAQVEHYQKQAERAQRRLLRETKTLAEMRRLLRPAVQINVADQQVNVAGEVHTGARKTPTWVIFDLTGCIPAAESWDRIPRRNLAMLDYGSVIAAQKCVRPPPA